MKRSPKHIAQAILYAIKADSRYAVRRLVASPVFTSIAALTLAIGIGVSTAIYSLLYSTMFRGIDVPDKESLVNINASNRQSIAQISLSWSDYRDLRSMQSVFEEMSAWRRIEVPLSASGQSELVLAEAVEGNYFDLLRVPVARGRPLSRSDDTPSAVPVVVISDRLWRSRFGADAGAVGQIVKLQGYQFEIVGIAPEWFRGVDMPNLSPTTLWIPLAHAGVVRRSYPAPIEPDKLTVRVKARLALGRTMEEAQAEVRRISQQLSAASSGQHPPDSRTRSPDRWRVIPASSMHMHESIDRIAVPVGYGVLATLVVLLAIAALNVGNLLLARAFSRQFEMATRVAVGATRARLLAQLLTENGLLCALGGAFGLLLAILLTRALTVQLTGGFGLVLNLEPRIEWPVLLAAMAATAFLGLAFGLGPAIRGAGVDAGQVLSGYLGQHSVSRWRMFLVALQFALSVTALVLGSLFVRGLLNAAAHDPGFDLRQVAFTTVDVDHRWGHDKEGARQFLTRFRDRVALERGGVAAIVELPIGADGGNVYLGDEDGRSTIQDGTRVVSARTVIASPEALSVLRISLVRGRFLGPEDIESSLPVAVVSHLSAQRVFGSADVVGRRIKVTPQPWANDPTPPSMFATVIGVTRDTDVDHIGSRDRGVIFVPFTHMWNRRISVAVRTSTEPSSAASSMSASLRELDHEILAYFGTGDSILSNEVLTTRLGAQLGGSLGALAFMLAVLGLYGLMSHLVSLRTRDIGIFVALGADRRRVLLTIMREAISLVAVGAAAGALGAYWCVGFVRRLIFGFQSDQLGWLVIAITVVLGCVGLIACWLPALRATRVDPVIAIRRA
jgi:putative ABC transport system permease protein